MIYILSGQTSISLLSIERFLHLNRIALADANIIIPLNGYIGWNHQNLFWELTNSPNFDKAYGTITGLVENIKLRKKENNEAVHIISLPTLSMSYRGLIQNFITKLYGVDEITLIGYYNHQLKYLFPYWYKERFSGAKEIEFDDWLKWRLACNAFSLDYSKEQEKLMGIDGIDQIKIFHIDFVQSTSGLLHHFLSQIIPIDISIDIDYPQSPIKQVFKTPEFPADVLDLSESLYSQSNNNLAKLYTSMGELNNLEYLK